MAKASAQITLHYVIDIQAIYRYYLLQSSTSAKPSKPTAYPPPATWDDVEPTYTSGSTKSLYFVDCTVFANNTFKYSEVSLSTSYEAAKEAYNKAQNAQDSIDDLEIGSRNYIQKTDIKTYHEEWIPYINKSTLSVTEDEYLKITPVSNSNYNGAYGPKISKLEANTEYTLSFEAYADANIILGYNYIMCDAGNKSLGANINITTTPAKYTLTFTTDKAYEDCSVMLAYRNTSAYVTVPFYLRRLCVNKGNKATDWTAAPEDVQENINNVQDSVNDVGTRVTATEINIDTLKKQIDALVQDENGYSLMTQTSTGWVLNMGDIYDTLDATAEQIDSLSGSVGEVDKLSKELNTAIEGLSNKTSYLTITEDANGQPCIELGQNTSDFKVRITNTAVDFMEGTSRIAYINNKTLYIEKAIIKTELHIGTGSGFIFAKRANGNMGIRWKESD